MDMQLLKEKFARIGSRVRLEASQVGDVSIDIAKDRKGEYFSLTYDPDRVDRLEAIDVQPRDRHLLLLTHRRAIAVDRTRQFHNGDRNEAQHKFLCGHDERHWFVAAVPGRSVSNVRTAMDALKPMAVVARQAQVGLKQRHRNRRKNRAFIRQGEWFFMPESSVSFTSNVILHGEPLSRGFGSKPHITDELVRTGGVVVYVSHLHPTGLTEGEHRNWVFKNPDKAKRVKFQTMVRDPKVYVRGNVRHPDHKTISLGYWHRVQMNREAEAPAARHVAFLD